MVSRILSLGAILLGAVVVVSFFFISNRHRSQATIFVGEQSGFGKDAITFPHSDWLDSFSKACPDAAFMLGPDESDYKIMATWSDGRWYAVMSRRDGALMQISQDPDYAKILREACERVRDDIRVRGRPLLSARGTAPESTFTVSQQADNSDRYELRDIRNGNLVTSAIFDKKTGRVWVWTTLTGKNGQKTGSAFVSEDVYSYSSSAAPVQN